MNIEYIKSGGYYIPKMKFLGETRTIRKWRRMHWEELINNG